MQQITITGYLSKDAEERNTQRGNVTALNIPVKQGWGEREQTNWYRVSVWGKRAEFAAKFKKGEFLCVTGELTIGEYNGKPQYEINASDFHSVRTAPRDGSASQPSSSPPASNYDDLDDGIPF